MKVVTILFLITSLLPLHVQAQETSSSLITSVDEIHIPEEAQPKFFDSFYKEFRDHMLQSKNNNGTVRDIKKDEKRRSIIVSFDKEQWNEPLLAEPVEASTKIDCSSQGSMGSYGPLLKELSVMIIINEYFSGTLVHSVRMTCRD